MGRGREILVADRPERPTVVFDGDCGFCRQWVERWKRMTGGGVEYRPSREVEGRYPEIGPEAFAEKVWLIEPDGRARGGAGAVFRLYALAGEKRWLGRLHEGLPGFAEAAEWAYGVVAEHRETAAWVTRWLWGDLTRRASYRRMRSVLLRGLGVVYVAAFASLAVQVDGLIGSRGILPAGEFLDDADRTLGRRAYWLFPTALWLDPSDRALHLLCWGGVAVGCLVVAGVLPGAGLVLLWAAYLSLTVAGQDFLGYQWDMLLLEAGLLGVLFAPWGSFWLGRAGEPSRLVVWLFRWLLFRVMFLSGVVKLASGDPAWRAWSAMRYHYETQPLPTWTSWTMHQLPTWFQEFSVGFLFWAELVAPVLIFAPRRPRLVAFASIATLQILIAATGNYGFFNLLTLVLCASLLEDRDLGAKTPEVAEEGRLHRGHDGIAWARGLLLGGLAAGIVLVTSLEGIEAIRRGTEFPWPLDQARRWAAPLRSLNSYGLFAVMTTERPEIAVEGSDDGETWKTYSFRWKPGDVDRRPRFVSPHMPRLDWQMWFAALALNCRREPWFLRFEERLLEGSPEVLALLRDNPFPDHPPRYVRARLELYRFTRWGSKGWWEREGAGLYCPPIMRRETSGSETSPNASK